MEDVMQSSEIERLVDVDLAFLGVTNCLVRFLDAKGVLVRSEFIGYLRAAAERLEREGFRPDLLRFFRAAIGTLEQDQSAFPTLSLH
jgi:hypothetical protein